MTFEEYLSNMKPGYTVDGGSEDHLIMHEMSQRALKITMELNNKYHTKEEIVQLALPYEILLQHASIVSCLCVFGISHFGLYYLYSSITYATTALGWSAFRRYSGSLASKSAVKAVSCSSLSFKIS